MAAPDSLIARLLACGVNARDIKGCSKKDIAAVAAGRALPEDYTQFLSLIGRGAGAFMSDLKAFYPAVVTLTEGCRARIAVYAVLPGDAFVFADRFGEQFLFFRLPDPAVYRWTDERPRRTKKVFKSFWAFVEEELAGFEFAKSP